MAALASIGGLHGGEVLPPLLAALLYVMLYRRRTGTLTRERRPVASWRRISFYTGVITVAVIQLPPCDGLADSVLAAHMVQHVVIGDLASLAIILGVTGPVLAPLLHTRASSATRRLSHPLVAVTLWAADLYAWHLPFFYQLAIEHDLVHALEHACMLWFGALLWLALIGPLPKPRWFAGGWELGYVMLVRFLGAVLANVLIWGQTVFYPVYRVSDRARGLSPLSDQSLAGGIMMLEQVILTTVLLAWLFIRVSRRDEERQSLLDWARRHGVPLEAERAARAAAAGSTARLRERVLERSQASERGDSG
ncbi:MAG: cytochrome c oxidase assembly protein [Solirubrobacteraceae bacterium]